MFSHLTRIAILLALLILVSAMASAQATKRTEPTRTHEPGGRAPTEADSNKSVPQRRAGAFQTTDGRVQGHHVQFVLDLSNCSLSHFQIYNTTFFDNVQLPGRDCSIGKGGPRSQVQLLASNSSITLHDSPNALLRLRSAAHEPTNLTLSEGVTVSGQLPRLSLEKGNQSASLFISAGNATNARQEGRRIILQDVDANFIAHPLTGNSPQRAAVREAITQGRVAAQIKLLPDAEGDATEVLAFADVDVKVQRPQHERLRVTVSANLTEGRVFITEIDRSAWDPSRLRVDYADVDEEGRTHPASIRRADSLDEVLALKKESGPLYHVYEDEQGHHVAVAVPSFSVHAFEIVGLPLQVVPLLLYGIIVVGLFFATGGVGIVLERRALRRG